MAENVTAGAMAFPLQRFADRPARSTVAWALAAAAAMVFVSSFLSDLGSAVETNCAAEEHACGLLRVAMVAGLVVTFALLAGVGVLTGIFLAYLFRSSIVRPEAAFYGARLAEVHDAYSRGGIDAAAYEGATTALRPLAEGKTDPSYRAFAGRAVRNAGIALLVLGILPAIFGAVLVADKNCSDGCGGWGPDTFAAFFVAGMVFVAAGATAVMAGRRRTHEAARAWATHRREADALHRVVMDQASAAA